jgi:hypothetical protein
MAKELAMASEKQIAANRRNAAKSKGPRSESGKARSKMNALRHGFATSAWQDPLKFRDVSKATFASTYANLTQKRLDVDRERETLLAGIDAHLGAGDCLNITPLLQRAAALERYDEEIAAAMRRLFKSLNSTEHELSVSAFSQNEPNWVREIE